MATVEDRIVQMGFDNRTFEQGATKTLGTLGKLKQALSFGKSKNGLDDIQKSASRFSMSGVMNQLQQATHKWSLWKTAALIAFATVVHQAVRAGERLLASFTIDPIKAGLESYNEQIQATQVILANTKSQGTTLKDVTATLKDLQNYANLTVYSFSEMTSNIGKFTAAGVPLKAATASIKGMANVAALSGANTQQMASAMYQMSQALSTGVIRLQDWNSLSNANMAGTNIQKALEATAHTMGDNGKAMDAAIKKSGNFRNSLQAGWLTSGIFNKTMKIMAGTVDKSTGKMTAFSVAQLKSMHYTTAQAKSLHELSQSALDSAIKIRTLPQLTQALKEEVATAYGSVFKTIFGDINQATDLFTGIHNVLENALTAPIYALNKLLIGVSALGGRTKAIDAIKQAFKDFAAVIKPIKDAFHEIFPPASAKSVYEFIVHFDNFMHSLMIGTTTANNLKRIFAGVFAVFDIGRQIIVGVWHVLVDLLEAVTGNSTGFLNFAGNIGDWLVALDASLKKGDALKKFFAKLGNAMAIPIRLLGVVKDAIFTLFSNFQQHDAHAISDAFTHLKDSLSPLSNGLKTFSKLWDKVVTGFNYVKQQLSPVIHAIGNLFGALWTTISQAFSTQNFDSVLHLINTGLLAGILLLFKKFLKGGINVDLGGGFLGSIKEGFEGLTGAAKAMQMQVKAKALLEIAAAIGILTASAVALALINPTKLANALKALAVGFGELLGSMAILSKISGAAGFVKVPIIATSMTILATAVLILSAAIAILAHMSWDELKKGLTGAAVAMGILTAASVILSKYSGGMMRSAIGIGLLAVAMNILFTAVKLFSTLDWSELGKGLAAVAGLLVGIAGGMQLMPKNLIFTGAGLLAVSVALNAIYLAVKNFSSLDWKTLARGLAGVAGSLIAIAGGMHLMPKNMIAQSIALTIVAAALLLITKAVKTMGNLDWKVIGTGLAGLGGALLILAGALRLMQDSLAGAAALLVVSAALHILAPIIITLGKTRWQTLALGLGALAAAFIIFGLAGLALAPVTPVLLALGVAFTLFGAALALAGVGVLAIGHGLGALAKAGSKAVVVLAGVLETFIKKIPGLAVGLAKGLVEFIVVIGKNAPKIAKAFGQIIVSILKVIVDNAPKIAEAGIKLILALVGALTRNMGKITKAAADLIVAFLKGISDQLPKVIKAVFQFVIDTLNGLADAIRNNLGKVIKAAAGVGEAIIEGIFRGIGSLLGWLWDKIKGFFSWIWDKIKGFFGIHSPSTLFAGLGKNIVMGIWNGISGFIKWLWNHILGWLGGLWRNFLGAVGKAVQVGAAILHAIWNGITGAVGWLWDKIKGWFGNFLNGLGNIAAGALNVGKDLLKGIWNGITSLGSWMWNNMKNFFGNISSGINHWLHGKDSGKGLINGLVAGITEQAPVAYATADAVSQGVLRHMNEALGNRSPSRFANWSGRMLLTGLAIGITKNSARAENAMTNSAVRIKQAMNKSLSGVDNINDISPVISPVLDLSNVRKDASKIGSMLDVKPISVASSFQTASGISTDVQTAKDAVETAPAAVAVQPKIEFTQNNNSPKTLSAIEIYRNTKNALSLYATSLGGDDAN